MTALKFEPSPPSPPFSTYVRRERFFIFGGVEGREIVYNIAFHLNGGIIVSYFYNICLQIKQNMLKIKWKQNPNFKSEGSEKLSCRISSLNKSLC